MSPTEKCFESRLHIVFFCMLFFKLFVVVQSSLPTFIDTNNVKAARKTPQGYGTNILKYLSFETVCVEKNSNMVNFWKKVSADIVIRFV